jgi:hypothetical protein
MDQHLIPRWINGELWMPMSGEEIAPSGVETMAYHYSVPGAEYAGYAAVYFNFTKYLRGQIACGASSQS